MTRESIKCGCKSVMNVCAWGMTWPLAALCRLQQYLHPHREEMFGFFAQCLALLPGLLGVYLRRGFYRQTLEACAADVFIGFGTLFTHRQVRVESGVYVGTYALIGCCILRKDALIGSRASLLSGGQLHVMDEQGNWGPAEASRLRQIEIGENAWLGEAVVVMSDVGTRAMVSAGSVVSNPVPPRVMVAGNPARFVKRFEDPAEVTDEADESNHTSSSPATQNGSIAGT